jgi:hypothetical protein
MRRIRRVTTTAGFLFLALLPVAAAVSPETPPSAVPVAITQPLTMSLWPTRDMHPMLPESGLLVLIGGGLMGLAAVVRRTTKV